MRIIKQIGLTEFFQKQWFNFLFIYHCFFICFAYFIRVNRGASDAHLYWAQSFDINKQSWVSFADYGTPFIIFLNYPFIKLGFPFWFGFLIYGLIGFMGIIIYIKWIHLVIGEKLLINGINILPTFYFLPNLHFWTAGLGKEPLIFFGLASIFYAIASNKYITFSLIGGCLLVILIRPHVAMMLLASIIIVGFLTEKYTLKKRLIFVLVSFSVFLGLLYMVFQLTKIRYWNWNRILYFNDFSILSFRRSGSYVPMLDYSLPYQLFSFYFKPLFYDFHSILSFLASFENVFVLCIHVLAIFFLILFYKKIDFPDWLKTVFLFTIICGLLYIQRYANLGIFMRTKMIFQPFTIVGLLFIIKQGFSFLSSKSL